MNEKLLNDWKNSSGLFNFSILYSEIEYTADIQMKILEVIYDFLELKNELSKKLFFIEDWHEHDGFITKEREIKKFEIKCILKNRKNLCKNRDFYVYDLLYNETENFMLRWYSVKESENEIYCDFTLILPDIKDLQSLKNIIENNILGKGLKVTNAKKYFDKHYGG